MHCFDSYCLLSEIIFLGLILLLQIEKKEIPSSCEIEAS